MGRVVPARALGGIHSSHVRARAEIKCRGAFGLHRSVVSLRYWAQYDLAKSFLRSDDQGNAYGEAIYASGSVLAVVGCVHVAVSLYLCYAFLRPLRHADRRADPAMRAQMRRVLIASTVAVFSTLVCYGGIGRFAHPCLLLAVDSIINDLCLAILVLTDEEGSAARDASGLRVGVAVSLDDSPGLELSDGAVLS